MRIILVTKTANIFHGYRHDLTFAVLMIQLSHWIYPVYEITSFQKSNAFVGVGLKRFTVQHKGLTGILYSNAIKHLKAFQRQLSNMTTREIETMILIH